MIKLHLLDGSLVLIQTDAFIIHKAIGEPGTQVTTDAGQIRVSESLEEIESAMLGPDVRKVIAEARARVLAARLSGEPTDDQTPRNQEK